MVWELYRGKLVFGKSFGLGVRGFGFGLVEDWFWCKFFYFLYSDVCGNYCRGFL